jgi:hypothetical protein
MLKNKKQSYKIFFMVVAMRSKSFSVKLEPEGKHKPLSKRFSATLSP